MKSHPNIRNITVSGRIGSGATTLAISLQKELGWTLWEGGALSEKFHKEQGSKETDVDKRPVSFDYKMEALIEKMLKDKDHQIIQSHLAGFDAQNIPGIYKILVICEDKNGNDLIELRAQRLVERKGITKEEALDEIEKREGRNLKKWQALYAPDDKNWVYWNKKYFDLVINTAILSKAESLAFTLKNLNI